MRGAVLSMLYSKILRLRGLKEKTVGEVCTNQSMFKSVLCTCRNFRENEVTLTSNYWYNFYCLIYE